MTNPSCKLDTRSRREAFHADWVWVSLSDNIPQILQSFVSRYVPLHQMYIDDMANKAHPVIANGDEPLVVNSLLKMPNCRHAPLFFIGADQSEERAMLIDQGADDVLQYDMSDNEIAARLMRVKKHYSWRDGELDIGPLHFNTNFHTVEMDGQSLDLMPREFKILLYLARNNGQLVKRSTLLKHIWRMDFSPRTNSVEVHMCRLRTQLKNLRDLPKILTIKGQGYRLDL